MSSFRRHVEGLSAECKPIPALQPCKLSNTSDARHSNWMSLDHYLSKILKEQERRCTVESCESRHYQTMLNCNLFIHALAKWLDITSFDAEMIALCLDGKATLISLTIILINTLEAGSHTTALARFYSIFVMSRDSCSDARQYYWRPTLQFLLQRYCRADDGRAC